MISINTRYRFMVITGGALLSSAFYTLTTDNDPYNFLIRFIVGTIFLTLATTKAFLRLLV